MAEPNGRDGALFFVNGGYVQDGLWKQLTIPRRIGPEAFLVTTGTVAFHEPSCVTGSSGFPTTAAIDWLAEHAPEQGFVLSYPDGKQRLTGYRPEPWHVRFVGQPLASELRRSGLILEELFRARPDLGESGSCDDCPQPASRSACGDVDAAGKCEGNVLQWCYDDALASVDCGAFKQRCGRAQGADVHDCLVK